jgi:hypothetical protein
MFELLHEITQDRPRIRAVDFHLALGHQAFQSLRGIVGLGCPSSGWARFRTHPSASAELANNAHAMRILESSRFMHLGSRIRFMRAPACTGDEIAQRVAVERFVKGVHA